MHFSIPFDRALAYAMCINDDPTSDDIYPSRVVITLFSNAMMPRIDDRWISRYENLSRKSINDSYVYSIRSPLQIKKKHLVNDEIILLP